MAFNIAKFLICGKLNIKSIGSGKMENELVTDEHRKRIKEFQSLYYALNARPDTITKLYYNSNNKYG